jgi:hypothetical protein
LNDYGTLPTERTTKNKIMDSIAITERRYMADLHFEHEMWSKALNFYAEELKIFEDRLAEVSQKNTDHDVKAKVEHFQNQFIREKEVIDTLLHEINEHEDELVKYAKEHPVALDHVYFQNHSGLDDKMRSFNKIWKELRNEYMRFLAEWM